MFCIASLPFVLCCCLFSVAACSLLLFVLCCCLLFVFVVCSSFAHCICSFFSVYVSVCSCSSSLCCLATGPFLFPRFVALSASRPPARLSAPLATERAFIPLLAHCCFVPAAFGCRTLHRSIWLFLHLVFTVLRHSSLAASFDRRPKPQGLSSTRSWLRRLDLRLSLRKLSVRFGLKLVFEPCQSFGVSSIGSTLP